MREILKSTSKSHALSSTSLPLDQMLCAEIVQVLLDNPFSTCWLREGCQPARHTYWDVQRWHPGLNAKSWTDCWHCLDSLETLGGEVDLPHLRGRGASGEAVGLTQDHQIAYAEGCKCYCN